MSVTCKQVMHVLLALDRHFISLLRANVALRGLGNDPDPDRPFRNRCTR
jgi:hypothetical protein